MAIYRLLQNSPVDPETSKILTDAYEAILTRLDLADPTDPITLLIAEKVLEIGQTGVRDALQICEIAVKELGAE